MVTDTLASRLNNIYFTSQSKEGIFNKQKKTPNQIYHITSRYNLQTRLLARLAGLSRA